MRVIGSKQHDNGWTEYRFNSTLNLSWQVIVFMVRVIYTILENPEILLSVTSGAPFTQVDIDNDKKILYLPESSAVKFRGINKNYDNSLIQFLFVKNTNVVFFYVQSDYVNNIIISGIPISENKKLHLFDKFMDTIEVNTAIYCGEYSAASEIIPDLINTITAKESLINDNIYLYRGMDPCHKYK